MEISGLNRGGLSSRMVFHLGFHCNANIVCVFDCLTIAGDSIGIEIAFRLSVTNEKLWGGGRVAGGGGLCAFERVCVLRVCICVQVCVCVESVKLWNRLLWCCRCFCVIT